jgi:hypothetical protein
VAMVAWKRIYPRALENMIYIIKFNVTIKSKVLVILSLEAFDFSCWLIMPDYYYYYLNLVSDL